MWNCPKCNTNNESEFCRTCNEARPLQNTYQSNNSKPNSHQRQQNFSNTVIRETFVPPASTHSSPSSARKQNKGLIITCIVLACLLVVTSVTAIIALTKQDNSVNKQKQYTKTAIEIDDETISEDFDKDNANSTSGEIISEEVKKTQDDHEEEPGIEKESEKTTEVEIIEENTSKPIEFNTLVNEKYNFSCAYPNNFNEVDATGINAIKKYKSDDGTAIMTVRATEDKYGITIDQAVSDFKYEYNGEVTYYAHGDTWYAISCKDDTRIYYRKFFTKNGNMYCFDFEYDEEDKNLYYDCIEYIEDNFKAH